MKSPTRHGRPLSQLESEKRTQSVETQLLDTLARAETLGDGNPLLLSSLYSLAEFYRAQGELDKAESQYQRALSLKERISGPEHPDVATILQKYAALLREARRFTEAEHLIARANAITGKHTPPNGAP